MRRRAPIKEVIENLQSLNILRFFSRASTLTGDLCSFCTIPRKGRAIDDWLRSARLVFLSGFGFGG